MSNQSELFLSTDTPIEVEAVDGSPSDRWIEISHTGIVRPAFVLIAGDSATFAAPLEILPGSCLSVTFAAANKDLSHDGADLRIDLIDPVGIAHGVATLRVPSGRAGLMPRRTVLDLTPWARDRYRLRLQCGPGPYDDPVGDWVAIFDLAVGTQERLGALHALAFHSQRARNEIAHFGDVYEHAMYEAGPRNTSLDAAVVTPFAARLGACRTPAAQAIQRRRHQHADPSEFTPTPSGAYDYAHRLLGQALPTSAPDYTRRLLAMCEPPQPIWQRLFARALRLRAPDDSHRLIDMPASRLATADSRPLRILSLCSGAARFEAQFASAVGARAEWTLIDISEGLLKDAARNFPVGIVPELLLADLNEVQDFGERFDVVMCVSALHHIVDLERVIAFIQQVLVEDGEFWSVGEAIGRTGNRLYDEDYRVANAFFQRIPERLRRNRLSGDVDANLPNVDYSDATFEGIRSDEIEPMLNHRLQPVDVYRRNCFLWRLVDLAYADNYDLACAEDVAWLQRSVDAELEHFRAGGHPAELHGVFRKRLL